tara:strand:+ start:1020 stop:1727 length:708 start_codon:yes stop_codon:yes gene_type:complete
MKIVILCGGLGSRLSEETRLKPKPMVKIGNMPILMHIIKSYEKYGFNEFFLALGYKGYVIKKYFSKLKSKSKFHLINTGAKTLTGGRLLRLKKYFKDNENFMLTYGDGLSGQNIKKLVNFHKKNKKIATMTVVRPPVRFGEVKIQSNLIKQFKEKPQISSSWINGGFFVLNSKIFKLIKNDQIMLEREPLEKLSKMKQLCGFKHHGFWQCMDTLREKKFLEEIFKKKKKKSPWLI